MGQITVEPGPWFGGKKMRTTIVFFLSLCLVSTSAFAETLDERIKRLEEEIQKQQEILKNQQKLMEELKE